jgi:hypothetical protein
MHGAEFTQIAWLRKCAPVLPTQPDVSATRRTPGVLHAQFCTSTLRPSDDEHYRLILLATRAPTKWGRARPIVGPEYTFQLQALQPTPPRRGWPLASEGFAWLGRFWRSPALF